MEAIAKISGVSLLCLAHWLYHKKSKNLKALESSLDNKEEIKLQGEQLIGELKKRILDDLNEDLRLMIENKIRRVDHIVEWRGFPEKLNVNPILFRAEDREKLGIPVECLVPPGVFCIKNLQYMCEQDIINAPRYMKAGPKSYMYYKPEEVKVAIVTCGGLCPGLNVVIREIVMALWWFYKVRNIWGVRWGYQGFYSTDDCYFRLDPDKVQDIHQLGGTILGAGRDIFDGEKILDAIVARGINQVYVIGGDGTHKGIMALAKLIKARGLAIGLAGVPKTIDNDIQVIDSTFGFASAVDAAVTAIRSANVEACCADNGVGLIKLMGRDVGHIAMHATLASRDVNICLVPEFPFELDGPEGLLNYLFSKRLKTKKHCVIVVAEGAALGLKDRQLVERGEDPRKIDIGEYLKKEITEYAKKNKLGLTLKYIDPSYIIRTVPANSADKQLCSKLAQNAVHGIMAGFTNFTCGLIRGASVNLPIEIVAEGEKNRITPDDQDWLRLLANTRQPPFLNSYSVPGKVGL